jgi:hypothetical protein
MAGWLLPSLSITSSHTEATDTCCSIAITCSRYASVATTAISKASSDADTTPPSMQAGGLSIQIIQSTNKKFSNDGGE